METRHVATVEDIMSIEVTCSNPRCDGMLRISPTRNGIHEQQNCPSCGELWWGPHVRSNPYRFLMALLDLAQGTLKGAPPQPDTERWVERPPRVRLVLPGRLDN